MTFETRENCQILKKASFNTPKNGTHLRRGGVSTELKSESETALKLKLQNKI